MSIFLQEKVMVPNKTPFMLEIEKEANKIVKLAKSNELKISDCTELSKLFAKRFNLQKFKLNISKDSSWIRRRKRMKDKSRNKEGDLLFYTKIDMFEEYKILKSKKNTETINIYDLNDDYSFKYKYRVVEVFTTVDSIAALKSGSNLISILLHELGHNYYETSISVKIGFIFGIIFSALANVITFIPNVLIALPLNLCLVIIKELIGNGLTYAILNSIISTPINIFNQLFRIPANAMFVLVAETHKQEEFADHFVSLNGYGSDLGESFLINYKDRNKDTIESDAIRTVNTVDSLSLIWFSLFFTHPEMSVRLKNQITILQSELTLTKDPNEIRFIKNEIRTLEELSSDFSNEKTKVTLLDLSLINSTLERVKSGTVLQGNTYEDLRTTYYKRGNK